MTEPLTHYDVTGGGPDGGGRPPMNKLERHRIVAGGRNPSCGHPLPRHRSRAFRVVDGLAECPTCRRARIPRESAAARLDRKLRQIAAMHESAAAIERADAEAARLEPLRAQWRREAQSWLRRCGFFRTYTSRSGSAYYLRPDGEQVRVSDHAVPITPEREASAASWAHGRAEIRLDLCASRVDLLRQLVTVRRGWRA